VLTFPLGTPSTDPIELQSEPFVTLKKATLVRQNIALAGATPGVLRHRLLSLDTPRLIAGRRDGMKAKWERWKP
jgi:hypothetical protein